MNIHDIEKRIVEEIALIKEMLSTQKSNFPWITEKQAMKMLDVSKSTIQRYRRENYLAFSQFQNKIYYKLEDIEGFLEKGYSRGGVMSTKRNSYD